MQLEAITIRFRIDGAKEADKLDEAKLYERMKTFVSTHNKNNRHNKMSLAALVRQALDYYLTDIGF